MTVHATCRYCGKEWEESNYSEFYLSRLQCRVCKDKNIKLKKIEDSKVDYYVGCPDFPKKEDKKEEVDDYSSPVYHNPDLYGWGAD